MAEANSGDMMARLNALEARVKALEEKQVKAPEAKKKARR